MTAKGHELRDYRFGERRRAGLFGVLAPSMLIPLSIGLLAAWLGVTGLVPAAVGFTVAMVGAGLAFAKIRGRPAHELIPLLVRFGWRRLRSRHRWYRPVPLVVDDDLPVAVPDALAGLDLYEVDVAWLSAPRASAIGVVHDRPAGVVTGVLRVAGDGQFALIDPRAQELRLDGWGAALGGFARERSPVVRVAWRDWSAPVPVADQVGRLEARWADDPASEARTAYLRLMGDVAPQVVNHEVLVEVSVEIPTGRGLRGARGRGRTAPLAAAMSTLSDELRLFSDRLDSAGLTVQGVLSSGELISAMRIRSDPGAAEQVAGLRQSLAAAAGVSAPNFGPMTVREELAAVHVDRAIHRTWWFARWPRRAVPAGWLDRLIFQQGCTRTVAVVFEPIPPSRSDHAVDRELVSREANIESRQRRGFRVAGKDRKALEAAEAREHELNSGYPEMSYVGLVTLTAPDPDTLEDRAAQLEQVAAQVGVELAPMWGQQAAGWVASLPLGRSVARRLVST